MRALNLTGAIVVYCLVGFGFLGVADAVGGPGGFGAFLAAVLWVAGLVLIIEWRETAPQHIWLVPVLWPFAGWILPLGIITFLGLLLWFGLRKRGSVPGVPRKAPDRVDFERKLNSISWAARGLEEQIRAAIAMAEAVPAAEPEPASAPVAHRAPAVAAAFRPRAETTPAATEPPKPAAPPKPPREFDWSLFLGARGLALAGGIVMVLGIVFFFVLAANRGWLTPELRVGLGALISVAVFCAGLWVKRRFGHLYSALAAVSAGIAGAYATLLAATALYDFVPQVWALVAAAGIAGVGVAVSLAWSAQTVAGLGLIGAMLVPLMILVDQEHLSFVGTCFVAIVFVAAAVVAQRKGWREILLAAGTVSLPQLALLVAETHSLAWRVVVLAAVFWLLYLGAGIGWQLRFGTGRLEPVTGALIVAGAALATYSCTYLFDGESLGLRREALALLAVAAAHGVLAALFFGRRPVRDLSSILWAIALTLGAVGVGELFTGPSLTAVWAAVAVLLVWLAERTGELRLRLPAAAYLLLAVGDALAREAMPRDLFVAVSHPGAGTPSVIAAAGALAAFAWYARGDRLVDDGSGAFTRVLALGAYQIARMRSIYLWAAGMLTLYAASLGLLELSAWIRIEDLDTRFARGEVAVHGLWAAVAVALVEIGLRRRLLQVEVGGLALLSLTFASALLFAIPQLPETERSLLFLAVAAGALLAGYEYGRLSAWVWRLGPAGVAIVASAALAAAGIVALAHGDWHRIAAEGGALVGLALVYAAFSASVFRSQRDLATLLWALALALGIAGLSELLSGRWLVLSGALLVAGLALLARSGREARLQLAAVLVFALAFGYALWHEAPPRTLFVAQAHPGAGVLALLFLAGAAGVLAACAVGGSRVRLGLREPLSLERVSWFAGAQPIWRAGSIWLAGLLVLYAASLGVLELFVRVANFGWGHVGLAGLWATVVFGLIEVGMRRSRPELEAGGFALLAFGIAEAVAYDLDELAHTVWALSFLVLAGGALLAGFEYARRASLRERLVPGGAAILASAALSGAGLVALAHGEWHGIAAEGGALVAAALVFAFFSAPVFRAERNLATLLWALGLAFAVSGGAELLTGRWLFSPARSWPPASRCSRGVPGNGVCRRARRWSLRSRSATPSARRRPRASSSRPSPIPAQASPHSCS